MFRRSWALVFSVALAACGKSTVALPPIANAGLSAQIFTGQTAVLDGSAGRDPAGETLTYQWTVLSATSGGGVSAGQVVSEAVSYSFTPSAAGQFVFSLTVTNASKLSGSAVVGVTVGNSLSVTVLPADGFASMAGKTPVVALFNAALRPWTVNGTMVILDVTTAGSPVAVLGGLSAGAAGRAVVFTPVQAWTPSHEYQVTITTAPEGLDGAPLPKEVVSTFTGSATDTIAPTVLSVSPTNNATGLPLGTVVQYLFSEPIDPASVTGGVTLVEGGGAAVNGAFVLDSSSGIIGTFIPEDGGGNPAPLSGGVAYTATILSTIRDLSGNALVGEATTFTTGSSDAPLTVLSISPIPGAHGVSVTLPTVVTFSGPVNPATLTTGANATFSLGTGGTGTVSGTITMELGNQVAVFTPHANLSQNTTYSVDLSAAITDLAGHPLEHYASSFLTGSAPPPTVLLVSPPAAPRGSTVQVDIFGQNFVDGSSLNAFVEGLNGEVFVANLTFLSANQLQASLVIDASAQVGARSISVTNPDGQSNTGFGTFSVLDFAPAIDTVAPAGADQGASGVALTVTGSTFQSGGVISIVGTGVTVGPTTFVNSGDLTTTVSVATTALLGALDVTVTDPDGQVATLPNAFTVRLPAPTVTSISSVEGGQGQSLLSVLVLGSNFQSTPSLPTISIGPGVLVSTINVNAAGTQITVNITIQGNAPIGPANVVVSNADGQTGTLTNGFLIQAAPPSVASASPAISEGTTVPLTVTGTFFTCTGSAPNFTGPTLKVVDGGTNNLSTGITVGAETACSNASATYAVTVTSNSTISSILPHDAKITNGDGQFAVGSGMVVIRSEAPQISSLSVTSGRINQTLGVNINGKFFQNGASVSFGTGIAVTVSGITANQISATITITSSAPLGAGNTITVTNPDGQLVNLSGAFTVKRAIPVVGTPAPAFASRQATPFAVTINGADFDCSAAPGSVPTVNFGDAGVTVSNVSCGGSTSLFATALTATVNLTASATLGLHNINVENPGDSVFGTGTAVFNVNAEAPVLTSASPSPSAGDTADTVNLVGRFFQGSPLVTIGGGITVNSVTFVSSSALTLSVAVPVTLAPGSQNVTVQNVDGQSVTLTNGLTTLAAPSPTVISATPAAGQQGASNVSVTISGTNFQSGAAVVFNATGITVNSTTFVSATALTVNINISGTATKGLGTVTVTNPNTAGNGNSVTSGNIFTVTGPPPTITSISPVSMNVGTSSTLTINGTLFQAGPTVSISGTKVTISNVVFVSASQLTCTVTIAAGAAAGARNLTVTNTDGGSVTDNGVFTVTVPAGNAPTITAIVKDPNRTATTAFLNDRSNSIRFGEDRLFHILGSGFQSGATVTVSGSAVVTSAAVFVNSSRIDVHIQANLACAFPGVETGFRDVTVTNPSSGDGLSGTLANGLIARDGLVLNEILLNPQNVRPVDRFRNSQYVEIFNGSGCPRDIKNMHMTATLNSGVSPLLETYVWGGGGSQFGTAVQEEYSTITCPGANSVTNLCPGGFAGVNVDRSNFTNSQEIVFLTLTDTDGNELDRVEIGDDPANNGNGNGALCAGCDGTYSNPSGANEQSVARAPNGNNPSTIQTNTGTDNLFWFLDSTKQPTLGGPFQMLVTDGTFNGRNAADPFDNCAVTNNCPTCADGKDNDGDGWIDADDPACMNADGSYNPLAEETWSASHNTVNGCNPQTITAGKGILDPNCLNGLLLSTNGTLSGPVP